MIRPALSHSSWQRVTRDGAPHAECGRGMGGQTLACHGTPAAESLDSSRERGTRSGRMPSGVEAEVWGWPAAGPAAYGLRSSPPHQNFWCGGSLGFTLVELLVTTSLMALVGGAAVAALSGGLRVWERAAETGTGQESLLIAFTQLRRDLQNVRAFKPVPFDGAYDRFTFATADVEHPDATGPQEVGQRGYYLDELHHVLCRAYVPYRLMRRERITDRCRTVLEGVTRVRFSYFGTDKDSGAAGWSQHWRSTEAPIAVKAELAIQSDRRQPASTQTFVINLAAAFSHETAKP